MVASSVIAIPRVDRRVRRLSSGPRDDGAPRRSVGGDQSFRPYRASRASRSMPERLRKPPPLGEPFAGRARVAAAGEAAAVLDEDARELRPRADGACCFRRLPVGEAGAAEPAERLLEAGDAAGDRSGIGRERQHGVVARHGLEQREQLLGAGLVPDARRRAGSRRRWSRTSGCWGNRRGAGADQVLEDGRRLLRRPTAASARPTTHCTNCTGPRRIGRCGS